MEIQMNKKERTIITQFRKNARENLTTASRKTHIPVSTLYDHLKRYEGNIITRHAALLDFNQLGYSLKIQMVLKVKPIMRKKVEQFLLSNEQVNTLCIISNDYDFLIEVILRDFKELTHFSRQLDSFDLIDKHEFYVVDELKKETFLTEDIFYDTTK